MTIDIWWQHQGDIDVLDMLLFSGDAENKFPGDINTQQSWRSKRNCCAVCDELQLCLDESSFLKRKWKTSTFFFCKSLCVSSCFLLMSFVRQFFSIPAITCAQGMWTSRAKRPHVSAPFLFQLFSFWCRRSWGKVKYPSVFRRAYVSKLVYDTTLLHGPFCLGFCFPAPWTWNDLAHEPMILSYEFV